MKSFKVNRFIKFFLPLFFSFQAITLVAKIQFPTNSLPGLLDTATAKKQLSEEVLLAMETPKNLEIIIERTVEGQLEASPALKPFKKELEVFFKKTIGWESLKEPLIAIYVQSFSLSELKDLLVFFKSKTGKRYSAIAPEFSGMISEISMKKVSENSEELQSIFNRSQRTNQK
ncbi:MAG: DUF2059 domain-containing protein [Chloroherpetonaceae bacterium]|nr:DUF2059 domain-containing protein [Chloroherpetonaceae bacterium]